MTNLEQKIEAFVKLGDFFSEFCESANNSSEKTISDSPSIETFRKKIELAKHKNGWFTKENIHHSISQWSEVLTANNIQKWLSAYNLSNNKEKRIAIIMAGNIPLVGFHDLLSVLITGNIALVKLSSNDQVLLPFITDHLIEIAPIFKNKVIYTEGKLEKFDAVIATGSNNTARYFEHYFGQKPNIIRKNRNSVAVLNGNETQQQLQNLGEDIFRYYGLGCRSVSKLMVPKGYNFDRFFEAIYSYKGIIDGAKYANNYDYNKAVYLMSEFQILENGFLLLKEGDSYASPIATLFYEYYESKEALYSKLKKDEEHIQCVVANDLLATEVDFGKTQKPSLTDYADGIDTVEFLLKT